MTRKNFLVVLFLSVAVLAFESTTQIPLQNALSACSNKSLKMLK